MLFLFIDFCRRRFGEKEVRMIEKTKKRLSHESQKRGNLGGRLAIQDRSPEHVANLHWRDWLRMSVFSMLFWTYHLNFVIEHANIYMMKKVCRKYHEGMQYIQLVISVDCWFNCFMFLFTTSVLVYLDVGCVFLWKFLGCFYVQLVYTLGCRSVSLSENFGLVRASLSRLQLWFAGFGEWSIYRIAQKVVWQIAKVVAICRCVDDVFNDFYSLFADFFNVKI